MNNTTNYFRVNHPSADPKLAAYVFFDDSDEAATRAAHAQAEIAARTMKGRLSMFRPPLPPGPWDDVQVVGHRPRSVLEAAIVPGKLPQDLEGVRVEIEELDLVFARRRGKS